MDHLKSKRDSLSADIILKATRDDHPKIRRVALQNLEAAFRYFPEKSRERLLEAARSDQDPNTRATALGLLTDYQVHLEKDHLDLFEKALKDSSYMNVATALRSIHELDKERGVELAKGLEDSKSTDVVMAVAQVYAKNGVSGKNPFFMEQVKSLGTRSKIGFLRTYAKYLRKQDFEAVKKALPTLEEEAINGGHMYVQLISVQAIKGVSRTLKDKRKKLEEELNELRKKKKDEEKEWTEKDRKDREQKKKELRKIKEQLSTLQGSLKRIEKEVDNQRVLRFLGS